MLLKVMAFALGAALIGSSALAQTYTPTVDTSPDLGIIVPAATTSTTFSFASSSGTVSQSGSAVRRTSGTTRAQVTIACSGGNPCADDIAVKIGSVGTPTGKAGSLGNFNVTANSGTGSITGASGTNPITFTFKPKNKNTNGVFYIGADFPITANNSAGGSGTANSQFYVYVAHSPTVPTTGTVGTATATTYRGIAFSGTPTMNFGVISKPGASTTATLGPSSDTVSFTNGVSSTASGTINRAAFNLTGESSMAITVTVDSSFTMNRSGGGSLTVTTNNSGLPTALSGATTGTQGTASFYVGGSFPLDSSTLVGTYSGSFNVTAAYN